MRALSLPYILLAIAPATLGAPGPGPRSAQQQQFHLAAQAVSAVSGSQAPLPDPPAQGHVQLLDSDGKHERYEGHQVWRLDWARLSTRVKDNILNAADSLGLDIWRASSTTFDVRVPPLSQSILRSLLPADLVSTYIPDVQVLLDSAPVADDPLPGDGGDDDDVWNVTTLASPFHDGYHTLDQVYQFGEALVSHFNIVTSYDIGTTAEGRPIRAWSAKIDEEATPGIPEDGGDAHDENDKFEFIIQANQHAREWVSSSAAMYFLHSLVLDATADPTSHAAQLLRTFTFTVVAVVNPDGFTYSHEHSRLWRKNRQDVGGLLCKGIDLNGNWGHKFVPSRLACSESYSGQTAFEAHETRAMADYLVNGSNPETGRTLPIKAFIDLHSYGQLFMFPFAYSCADFPPDAENLMEAGLGVAKAMRMTTQGEGYQTGQACDLTYRSAGDAIDYSYAVADVRWSYSAELRDTGTYGFVLPPHLIRPTGEEVSAGLRYLATFIFDTEIDL